MIEDILKHIRCTCTIRVSLTWFLGHFVFNNNPNGTEEGEVCVCVPFLAIFNCVTKQQRMVTSWTIITFKVVRHETHYFEVCDIVTSQTLTRKTVA